MNTRRHRAKRVKLQQDGFVTDLDQASVSSNAEIAEQEEELRKSRIRDSNKEFARRMTILQSWSDYWIDYTTREGDAYPQQEARSILKRTKKITCPIESCRKAFTSIGGLKYHYARCNIERSFKCRVCCPPTGLTTRGELLRHMILNHYEELPVLSKEQKEIASTYITSENRTEKIKKDRRFSADTESACNAQQLVKAFLDLQNRAFKSHEFDERPFKDWRSSNKDWEIVVSEFDRKRYYPPELESVKFRQNSNEDWISIKTGESTILSRGKRSSENRTIFFTGGVNTSLAWLPKSPFDKQASTSPDLVAVSVNGSSMDHSCSYKESHDGEGCIQFWSLSNFENSNSGDQIDESKISCSLSYIVGHCYGVISAMAWCPLGTSWQPPTITDGSQPRVGLLALACGDGQIRILSVPHTDTLLNKATVKPSANPLEAAPLFKVKPIAALLALGTGCSTSNFRTNTCKSLCWDVDNSQKMIVAGYTNGFVALFDLANCSPILYTTTNGIHIYHALKSWVAHGAPVTGVAVSSSCVDRTFIATGSVDRHLKLWNPLDLNSCITTDRAPITKILWDFRYRGVITATDTAFTSFNNRVSYRYPIVDGNHNVTISTHRSTVWGLDNSLITNAIATSDGAGEVFVMPLLLNRSLRKDRNFLSTHSLYTMIPRALNDTSRLVVSPQIAEVSVEKQEPTMAKNDDFEENFIEADADFSMVERTIANKPTKFLLPIEHRPVESYVSFKNNFGLEFINYNTTALKHDSKIPESCVRASDTKNIYCDRPCDYPFSAINTVSWSPNANSFPYLLSCTQVGLCRLDKVQIVEQIYRGHVEPTAISNKH